MKKFITIILGIFLLNTFLFSLDEQSLRRRIMERRRKILEATEKVDKTKEAKMPRKEVVSKEKEEKDINHVVWEWGGWQAFSFINYDNSDKSSLSGDTLESLWNLDTRIWVRATVKQKNLFYLRIKNIHNFYSWMDGVKIDDSKNDGPDIDMLYFKWKFKNASLKLGRQYLRLGRGLTYGNVHDGISYRVYHKNLTWKMFYSKNTNLDSDLDQSSPYEDDRNFLGLEGRMKILAGKHTLYAYGLWTKDNLDSPPGKQAYFYEPSYAGFGMEGSFFKRSYYWCEYVKESGSLYSYGRQVGQDKDDISAWALYSGSMYFLKGKTKPYLVFEYLMGSGDKDDGKTDSLGVRSLYPVTNTAGTDAKTFHSFGYVDLGSAFNGTLSNLKVSRVGFFFSPFGENKYHRAVTMGVKYSKYKKMYAESPTADYYSDQLSRDVGDAWDLYCNWQLMDDLNLYINYSAFKPGDAYQVNHRDTYKYLYASLNLSF